VSLRQFLGKILGNANERELQDMQPLVDEINGLEDEYESLPDGRLRAKTDEFLKRLDDGETLDDILVEAFALVREASKRTTGLRPYDVQLLGGVALHRGRALEMKTGEGKTLVATLPLYLNALTGKGVHLVTVNDYLARRDIQWMGPIYHLLGLRVGLLQQGQDQSFVFDPDYKGGGEDYRMLRPVPRRQAYAAHITYGTNSEFGFDYLRDNSARALEDQVQRGFHYAIVDEVDNILIDEARTPLIISGPSTEATDEYYTLAKVVRQLAPDDYEIEERTRNITLTDAGYDHVEQLLGTQLFDPDHPEETSPQQAKLLHHLEQALKAEYIMQKNRQYIVQGRRVVIVDEFTGRTMPGRRWSDGLHQAVEAKEGVPIQRENITYATITLQNYFRMYEKLSGMTGTAATEAEEFEKIYNLQVLILPTNRPVAREDHPDVVLRTEEGKFRAVIEDIVSMHCLGRPVLVGTTSVETSEHLSNRLENTLLQRWASMVLIRDRLNSRDVDNAIYKEGIKVLSQPLEAISASELRKLGSQVDISGRPTDPTNLKRLAGILAVEDTATLSKALSQGLPHSVLNARHHTEEARIVARAGESGAVTIATNMAGRGVDIKLGGEIDEEAIAQTTRVLNQNDIPPYGLSFEEMADTLRELDPGKYYLYKDSVERFVKHVDDEKRVKELGGLHVLGTERHESRRIDNQLRGRSGRQGDPGSSRFYLSMEDDLMRRFGGSKAKDLIDRLGAEDDIPIALGIVSRAIANAQTQVEGYNFDIRKHLLDYDDVLNTQREVIYEQRRRILSKQDLREDVWEIVKAEIKRHIDAIWADETPDVFRLVNYLEHVQPTAAISEGELYPSFSLQYVLSTLPVDGTPKEMRAALREAAQGTLESQVQYTLDNIRRNVERTFESESASIDRLLEAAGIAYEGIEVEFEESGRALDPQNAARAVSQQTGLQIEAHDLQGLQGRQLERAVMDQVHDLAQVQVRARMIAQVQIRSGIQFAVDKSLLTEPDERVVTDAIMRTLEQATTQGIAHLLKEIEGEIEAKIRQPADCTASSLLRFLNEVQFGTRTQFDKSHRRVSQRTQRFQYGNWVADQIAGWDRDRLESEILDHLDKALMAWEEAWGRQEMQRISSHEWSSLDEKTRAGIKQALGNEQFASLEGQRVSDLTPNQAQIVRTYLGERVLFNVQRQLMLDITSRYWVEHLTAMEVLRQGIGLQSYGQKDPLAEYKVRAYDMFQDLLLAIQSDLVAAMFTYRPRDLSQVRVGVERKKAAPRAQPSPDQTDKRKRKRRKKRRS
jgi:preprotein translocase subunit SecA